jgi:hypothetical protein
MFDSFQHAKVRRDVQVEHRGDETFRVEFADLRFAALAPHEILQVFHVAVVDGDDEVFPDQKINRYRTQRAAFAGFDRNDEKMIKIGELINFRSLVNS